MTHPTADAVESSTETRWACPFCPLHCFDGDPETLVAQCGVAGAAWATLDRPAHRIGTAAATLAEVAAWNAEQPCDFVPHIRVAGATLAEARWLLDWVEDGRVTISSEMMGSDDAISQAICRDGIVSATLGEVQCRADMVCLLGEFSSFPRIEHWIGEGAERIELPSLSPAMAMNLSTGQMSRSTDRGPIPIPDSSRYFAILIGERALTGSLADQTVAAETLVRWVASLNAASINNHAERRAVLVTVSNSASLENVARWRTNADVSSRFSRVPSTKAETRQTHRSFRVGSPILGAVPVQIQVGGVDAGPSMAKVYVATAIAGVDHADMVVRGDGSVTLPLTSLRPGGKMDGLAQFADARIGLQTPQATLEMLLHR